MARWLARGTVNGTSKVGSMTVPPMRWAMNPHERKKLLSAHPNITEVHALGLPRGRGAMGELIRLQHLTPGLRTLTPAMTLLRFGA
jgi:hypothetical protein